MNDLVFWLWAPALLTLIALFGIAMMHHDVRTRQRGSAK
jgi:hypothetical protein